MKLVQLHEARYATNYYGARWCNADAECGGFIGPTKARVGDYEVTGVSSEMFKPDYGSFDDEETGEVYVRSSIQEVEEAFEYGRKYDVMDDSRTKFGLLITTSSDFTEIK